jgi:hypothetical protein
MINIQSTKHVHPINGTNVTKLAKQVLDACECSVSVVMYEAIMKMYSPTVGSTSMGL